MTDPSFDDISRIGLPAHGRVSCTACHGGAIDFDRTRTGEGDWRITANPLAWGSRRPEVLVLGFSKGPTQALELGRTPHDAVAFKGGRANLLKILVHLGLANPGTDIDRLIADKNGRFAFGSLIRCSVERREGEGWTGTGGGMLDRFVATPFGRRVATNCATRFLKDLPPETRLVVMLGLGTRLGYVGAVERVVRSVRASSSWRRLNEVSYGDAAVTFVHTEHFKSQGRLLPDWLGHPRNDGSPADPARQRLGRLAAGAARAALA